MIIISKEQTKMCVLHVVLPLMIGFIYYYLFCPDIVIIKKIDLLIGKRYHIQLPQNITLLFFRYYMLDALWAYAMTHCFHLILGNNAIWYSIGLSIVMSITMEVLQLLKVATGTFDIMDIMIEIFAISIAMIIIINQTKGDKKNEKSN